MAKKYTINKGILFPKHKIDRDRIKAGKMTSKDVTKWERHRAGETGVTLPADVVVTCNRRNHCVEVED